MVRIHHRSHLDADECAIAEAHRVGRSLNYVRAGDQHRPSASTTIDNASAGPEILLACGGPGDRSQDGNASSRFVSGRGLGASIKIPRPIPVAKKYSGNHARNPNRKRAFSFLDA